MQQAFKKSRALTKEGAAGICFAMIPVIGFVLFGLIPLIMAVAISFMDIKGFNFDNAVFVGLGSYKAVFADKSFYKAIVNTLIAAISMPVNIVLSLVVAALLKRTAGGWGKVFRVIFFLPYVCSIVALSTTWKWLYDANYGIINSVIRSFGGNGVKWLTDSKYVMLSMIIMSLWSGPAFGIILYSAALGNVNKSYYEAAQLDGATGLQQFFRITVPCISPTTFYLLTIGIIGALQDFTRFQIMLGNDGGYNESGLTIVFYLWRTGWQDYATKGMGMAAAVSIVLTAGIIVITRLNFWLSKWWVHYES